MKRAVILFLLAIIFFACSHDGYKDSLVKDKGSVNVLFLHHSTGRTVFNGAPGSGNPDVITWFNDYNKKHQVNYNVVEKEFPKNKVSRFIKGYGWNNYPYDYYNIWVKNGDKGSYKYEPTLKTLTPLWDVIVFKHCFPVSNIGEGMEADINSDKKTLANYKLQYKALKEEMLKYPDTKFILWTGAALTEKRTTEEKAQRAKGFFKWVVNEWDQPDDNIFIWDFYKLETEGGLYLKEEYARSVTDSHPNKDFASKVAPLFCQRIVEVNGK